MEPRLAFAGGWALGCSVRLVVTRPRAIRVADLAVARVLRAVDESCSRFRDDSEVRRLEASAGRDVALSPMLAAALGAALRAARTSAGAVDPTVGGAVSGAGYDRDFALVAPEGGPVELAGGAVPGWWTIRLDPVRRIAAVPTGGGVLVSLGGDVAMRGEPPEGGWQVQVGEDSRDAISPRAEAVRVAGGGIATSSTTVRRWRRGDATLHHLIDPRTGRPAGGPWRTATVAAATCVDANTASTAAIVLGEAAADWLGAAGLPARLVDRAGAVTRIGGWPAPATTEAPAA
jgi:thiamine biosynthesis lipoprotein